MKNQNNQTKQAKIIAVVNQKGGVGKTTTVAALGVGLSKRGYNTLIIDLDPQGSLTTFFGIDTQGKPTALEFLGVQPKYSVAFKDVAVSVRENLDIIPADITLEEASQLVFGKSSAPGFLKKALSALTEQYDYILIDTSPSLSILTINALVASQKVLITAKPETVSMKGVHLLMQTIEDMKSLNPAIELCGFLINMLDGRRKYEKEQRELFDIAKENGTFVFANTIRAGASGARLTLDCLLTPKPGTVASDYDNLITEFLTDGRLLVF